MKTIISDGKRINYMDAVIEKMKKETNILFCVGFMGFVKFRERENYRQKCKLYPCFQNKWFEYYHFEKYHFLISITTCYKKLIFAFDETDLGENITIEFRFSENKRQFIIDILEDGVSKSYVDVIKKAEQFPFRLYNNAYRGFISKPNINILKENWQKEFIPEWKKEPALL